MNAPFDPVTLDGMIDRPRLPPDHADRSLECQETIEARIVDLIDEARAAGWTVADITTAIVEVAENLRLQADAMDETERQIADAVRKASS